MMIGIVLLHTIAAPGWAGWLTAWGWDNDGQVRNTPSGGNSVAVSAAGLHNVALKSDGSLVAWGTVSASPAGNDFVVASAGHGHHVAIVTSANGVLGFGPDSADFAGLIVKA